MRRLTAFFFALFVFAAAWTAVVPAQSLALKKAQKEIDETIPDYKKEIVEKCGEFKFDIKIDYNSFAAIPERVFLVQVSGMLQVRNALRAICTQSNNTSSRDEDGAQAVREKIKTIFITNIADPKKKALKLSKEGVLTIESAFIEPAGVLSDSEIRKLLTALL